MASWRRVGRWHDRGQEKEEEEVERRAEPRQPSRNKEVVWAARVKFKDVEGLLRVSMAGLGMVDAEMEQWCVWFRTHLRKNANWRGSNKSWLWAGQVDFADNQLTAVGADLLLETLRRNRVAVLNLKLHHNSIAEGEGVAAFLQECEGSLRELHLSHNELDAEAAAKIIAAAILASYEDGESCYPRWSSQGRVARGSAVPLWLRIEQNRIDQALLNECITASLAQHSRKGKALCTANSKGCTPHSCSRHSYETPAVHAKNLANQRQLKSASSTASVPAKSPRSDEDTITAVQESDEPTDKLDDVELVEEEEEEEEEEAATYHSEQVVVLRWDEASSAWVRDWIEVQSVHGAQPFKQEEDLANGPEKDRDQSAQLEVTDMAPQMTKDDETHCNRQSDHKEELLSLSLKQLIGIGCGAAELDKAIESELSRAKAPVPTPPALPLLVAARSVNGNNGRRGSQPSSADVRQATQAREASPRLLRAEAPKFMPGPHAPSEIGTKASLLNPEAPEFMPSAVKAGLHRPTSTSADVQTGEADAAAQEINGRSSASEATIRTEVAAQEIDHLESRLSFGIRLAATFASAAAAIGAVVIAARRQCRPRPT